MMKKLLRKITAAAVVVCMVAALAACGDEQTGSEDLQTSGKVDSAKEDEPEEVSYTFSEALAREGMQIWYEVNTSGKVVGKDTDISNIYVITDGELTVYPLSFYGLNHRYSLGELERMTDEEILGMLKSDIESRKNEPLELAERVLEEGFLDGMKSGLRDVFIAYEVSTVSCIITECDFSAYKSVYEQYIADLKNFSMDGTPNGSHELHIRTDSTGNNTQSEEWSIIYDRLLLPKLKYPYFEVKDGEICGSPYNSGYGESNINYLCLNVTTGEVSYKEGPDVDSFDWQSWYQKIMEKYNYGNYEELREFLFDFSKYTNCTIEYEGPQTSSTSMTLNLLGSVYSNYQIYDSYYGGYRLENNSYLLTRTGALTTFTLDPVGTEGVAVD